MISAVSVVLPVYNGSLFLQEQIASILQQSFADLTLLIADDGSSDDSVDIISTAARTDPRIQVLPGAGNVGQKRRLFELMQRVKSPLLAFSDQDDIWRPDKLAKLMGGIGEASLAFGRSQLVDETGADLGATLLEALQHGASARDRLTQLFQPIVSAHAMLVRREAVSPVATCTPVAFDWLIALEAAFSSGIVYVDDALTLHRMHGGNQSNGGVHEWAPKRDFNGFRLPRSMLRSGQFDRFEFARRLEYMAHSLILPEATRRAFHHAWSVCSQAWFINPASLLRVRDDATTKTVEGLLAPFSGSANDWTFFTEAFGSLTSDWRGRRPSGALGTSRNTVVATG